MEARESGNVASGQCLDSFLSAVNAAPGRPLLASEVHARVELYYATGQSSRGSTEVAVFYPRLGSAKPNGLEIELVENIVEVAAQLNTSTLPKQFQCRQSKLLHHAEVHVKVVRPALRVPSDSWGPRCGNVEVFFPPKRKVSPRSSERAVGVVMVSRSNDPDRARGIDRVGASDGN